MLKKFLVILAIRQPLADLCLSGERQYATIARVSADIVTDNRTGAQFYTAEATPNPGETVKLGAKALLPGMPVEVYIRTGSHSPLAYILKPFTDYFAPALKE